MGPWSAKLHRVQHRDHQAYHYHHFHHRRDITFHCACWIVSLALAGRLHTWYRTPSLDTGAIAAILRLFFCSVLNLLACFFYFVRASSGSYLPPSRAPHQQYVYFLVSLFLSYSSRRNVTDIHYFGSELYCRSLINTTIKLNLMANNRSIQRRTFLLVRTVGKTLMLFRNVDVPTSRSDCNGNLCPTAVPWPGRFRICVHRHVRRSSLLPLLPHPLQSIIPIATSKTAVRSKSPR